jgi:hypothetical protein
MCDAADQDLAGSRPTPGPMKRFTDHLKHLAAANSNAVMITTVTTLTTELMTKLEPLLH